MKHDALIAVPKHMLIPLRQEHALARRWFNLCVNEGHVEAPVDPNAPKEAPQDAIAVNLARGRASRQKVLKAIQEGHNTILAVREHTGMSDTNTRKVISKLHKLGRIRQRERVNINGRAVWIWEVVPV
jgi:hypothetical protein